MGAPPTSLGGGQIGCPGLRGVHYPVVGLVTGLSLIMPYLYIS